MFTIYKGMDNFQAVKTLSQVLDEQARGALTAYDSCAKAGRSNCDEAFEKNIATSKQGKATAIRLRDAIRSFYVCQASSSDPSVCAGGVKNAIRDIAASTAPRNSAASLPQTAMEASASAPTAPSAASIIRMNDGQKEQVVPPSSVNFDPSAVYAKLPKVNPMASIPLRDLVGRSMIDSTRNPFKNDLRPPVFPPLRPSSDLGVPEERIAQINQLKRQYAALQSGVGYSGRATVYCNQNLSAPSVQL